MKTIFTFRPSRLWRPALLCAAALAIMAGTSSCGSTGTYWGVDQSYPVGNGQVYYGAYGGDGPYRHHHDKKRYKKYRKEQKKWAKKQAKYRKKQMKEARKHQRKHDHCHYDD